MTKKVKLLDENRVELKTFAVYNLCNNYKLQWMWALDRICSLGTGNKGIGSSTLYFVFRFYKNNIWYYLYFEL